MSKAYTETEFSAQITEDRTWRLKEISDLKSAVLKADSDLRRVLLRSLITICYAHWEGYVRFAARKYLEHIALRKIQYKELDRQFLRNYFLPRLQALSMAKTDLAQRCVLIDEILDSSGKSFSRFNESLVNTKANLNFSTFSEICLVCCVPSASFAANESFVDVFLLKRRNSVAHGEDTFIDVDDLDSLTEGTILLMRAFGDALENHVVLKMYRTAPALLARA